MNTVLIHLGCQGPYISNTRPPDHLAHCIEQYKLFNRGDLYVITDRENVPHIPEQPGVFVVAAEDYYSDKVFQFNSRYKYGSHEFWSVSTTRFFYLEEFIKRNKLAPVVHFENDILVYFDLMGAAPVFKQLYGPHLALTLCDADQATSGFMYFGSQEAISHMADFFVDMLREHGMYGFEGKFKVHMCNDMTLMRRYADTRGAGGVHFLPTLPDAQDLDTLGGIFDPADYGQYFGGARDAAPGVIYEGHYVGRILKANPEYGLVWQAENGLRVPYLAHDGQLTRFNNLHIHSKKMEPFKSNV